MTSRPIVSLSLPKSGTTTLAISLRHAGLKVADWRIRRHETDNLDLQDKLLGPMIYEDYFKTGDPLARLGDFDAFTEINAVNKKLSYWPQTDFGILNAIQTHYPDAKFVLSLRDPAKVAKSIMGWNNLGKERLPKNDVPGLPRPFGDDKDDLARWVAAHYAFCEQMFRGSSNFLAYDLEARDVNVTIGNFLGLDLKWWGEGNTTENWNKLQRQEG